MSTCTNEKHGTTDEKENDQVTQPTYRRHPMDKRRLAPHPAPRSPKRLRHEQRFEHFPRRWLCGLADSADAARALAYALIPDTRQETRP